MTKRDWIDIIGLDKVDVVFALYRAARPVGIGMIIDAYTEPPSRQAVKEAIEAEDGYIDYLRGRPIKVDIRGDMIDVGLYDANHGAGAARRALESLLSGVDHVARAGMDRQNEGRER